VLAVGSTMAHLEKLRAEIGSERLSVFAADIATHAGAESAFAEAQRAFGAPADTLIHLVGSFAMAATDADNAPDVWNAMMNVNLTSTFCAFRAALPSLRASGGGYLVALGSRAAVAPAANIGAYAASKAAMVAFAQSLSAEVRDENIHVNVILASTIDTPANRAAMGEKNAPKWVSPSDIADATMYLCSPAAASVYGATLELYGKV
jgi:NAD(P)-dependent dehydrogenase (short-subunit alcohol dehydrogenase family)